MQSKSTPQDYAKVPYLRLITPYESHLPSRYTRSIYEKQYSQARHVKRLREAQEIGRVADHVVTFLRDAVVALSPIIGEKSVSALYKRSLYLSRTKHPWLSAAYGDLPNAQILEDLQNTVLRQTLSNAKAATEDLLAIFRELLHGLIGASLTQRLLGS